MAIADSAVVIVTAATAIHLEGCLSVCVLMVRSSCSAGTGGDGLAGLGGPAIRADVPEPSYITIGPDGALYAEDQKYGRILRIDLTTGVLTVAAGTPTGVTVTLPFGS